jgi:mannose-6-phosphate isomerase-like protein (cupin superfamily)
MHAFASDSAELTQEFGITVGRWAQYESAADLPFGAMWCVIPPGGRSTVDQHPDRELFVVVRGSAEVHVPGGPVKAVSVGDAVLMDCQEPHVLVNTSAEAPLVALSMYWIPEEAAESDVA